MSLYEFFLRIINKTDVIVYWSVMFTWICVIVYIMVCDVYLDLYDSVMVCDVYLDWRDSVMVCDVYLDWRDSVMVCDVYLDFVIVYIMVCDVYLDLCDSAPSWPTPERPALTSGGPRCPGEAWCLSLSCRLKPQNDPALT